MTTRKTLTSMVLVGVLALGISGCRKDHSQYKYDGKIGEDQVIFREKSYLGISSDDNILRVIKPDGRIIEYKDRLRDDLKLESVEITKDGQTTTYYLDDEIGKPILKEAQKQFDNYLQQIRIEAQKQLDYQQQIKEAKLDYQQQTKEAKIKKGLEDLK
ncbi:MAG: hypothetical protein KKG60_01310 [Nanoarchaeota archaeon]|nr:hypothetical protein [Nanoarchaeota archaeon]